jgi:hypothetical protein
MYAVPLDRLSSLIEREYGVEYAAIVKYALFRNDWKHSDHLSTLTSIDSIRRGLRRAIRDAGKEIVINLNNLSAIELAVEPSTGTLLDSIVYANRIYTASTAGLFESYFSPKHPDSPHNQVQLMDKRISCVSAKYSVLNASAEDEGLWFSRLVIGDDERDTRNHPEILEQIADVSHATSFASRHLLNYTDETVPQFMRARGSRRKVSEQASYDEWQVEEYAEPLDLRLATRAVAEGAAKVDVEEFASARPGQDAEYPLVLGNWNYRLLTSWQSILRVIDISAYNNKSVHLTADRGEIAPAKMPMDASDILRTYPINGGFLVELFDSVRLLTAGGSYEFYVGEAARVRTFVNSLRYQDVAAIVNDRGISLVGSFAL